MKQSALKRISIITVAFLLMFGFRFLPAPDGLSASGMQVVGIFAGVLLLWLTIAIDWPSIIALLALALIPELRMAGILASSFGNTTFIFLMFTFVCTYALTKTSFVRKCVIWFITNKIAQKGPWHFVTLYFASVIFVGLFIAPTVLFVLFLPITEEIYKLLKLEKGNKVAAMFMMGLVVCCGLSSGMTPIAHVFPLIAMGIFQDFTGIMISYASYMGFAIPVGIIVFILMMLLFRFVLRPNMNDINQVDVSSLSEELAPFNKNEKLIIFIFGFVVFLWVFPGIIIPAFPETILGEIGTFIDSFGWAMPPILGVAAMAMITDQGEPLLNINEALTKGVAWPSLMLLASTLALGSAISNDSIGLITFLSTSIAPLVSNITPILFVLFAVSWAAIQTNFSSGMVASSIITTIVMTVVISVPGVNAAAVASLVGMMTAYAFATPPAMPCVAIAGASGWTNTIQMMKYGFAIMIISIIVSVAIGYPLASVLMG